MTERSADEICTSCSFWRSLSFDLYAMIDAVARTMRGPAVLEDSALHVLAYSSLGQPDDDLRREAILGRRTPASWRVRMRDSGVLERLQRSNDVVSFPGSPRLDTAARLVTAIHLDGSMIGALWLSEGEMPFDERACDLLRAAAVEVTASVEHQLALQPRNSAESRLLRSLLEQAEGDPDSACRALGIASSSLCFVAALATDFGSAAQADKLIRRVPQSVHPIGMTCVTTAIGDRVYALLAAQPDQSTAALSGPGRVLELLTSFVGATSRTQNKTVKLPSEYERHPLLSVSRTVLCR